MSSFQEVYRVEIKEIEIKDQKEIIRIHEQKVVIDHPVKNIN